MGVTNNNQILLFEKTERSINTCHKCDKKFQHGERIYHKRGSKRKAYHLECWKLLLQ